MTRPLRGLDTLAPLQRQAEELLARLKRKGTTRGDVEAVIQGSIDDFVVALAAELCPACREDGRPKPMGADGWGHEDDDDCAAERVWQAYEDVRPRLWGRRLA